MPTEKVSSERLMVVLSALPEQLRKLASERDEKEIENAELRAQLESYKTRERATKIAQTMQGRGHRADEPIADIVADLEKRAAEFPVFEAALEMNGPSMNLFGAPGGNAATDSAESRFIAAIMND